MRPYLSALVLTLLAAALVTATPPADPLQSALKNGTYDCGGRALTLKSGMYAESAGGFAAQLLPKWIRTGDLNGDGRDDALAVVAANRMGHDFSHYLVAVLDSGDGNYVPAAGFLGELLELDAVEIAAGEVQVDLRFHAPGDKLCCPTVQAQRRFALEHGKFLCRFSNSLGLQPEAVHIDSASPFGAVATRIETGRLRIAKAEEPGNRYPEHVRLWLGGRGTSGAVVPAEPQLRVLPVAGYEAMLDGAELKAFREQLKALKSALAKAGNPPASLPLFPPPQAAPQGLEQPARVEFKNGAGIRFHAALNGAPLYIFQGVTQDGAYLVSFFSALETGADFDTAADRWLSTLDVAGN